MKIKTLVLTLTVALTASLTSIDASATETFGAVTMSTGDHVLAKKKKLDCVLEKGRWVCTDPKAEDGS